MRIPMSCFHCRHEELRAEEEERLRAEQAGETLPERPPGRAMRKEDWYLADLEEDNAYIKKCRNSHTMRMTLGNARFELLFESGVVAMLMGFHREAISSIAAALERFYEFAIEVFTQRAGIDQIVFGEGWKLVARSSERQLGAFLFLYLTNCKKPFISGKARSEFDHWTAFRNEVIHQGQFPTPAKVREYAQYVHGVIRRGRSELKELDADAVMKVELRHVVRGRAAIEKKAGPIQSDKDGIYWSGESAQLITMLSTFVQGSPEDFDSRLADLRDRLGVWDGRELDPTH